MIWVLCRGWPEVHRGWPEEGAAFKRLRHSSIICTETLCEPMTSTFKCWIHTLGPFYPWELTLRVFWHLVCIWYCQIIRLSISIRIEEISTLFAHKLFDIPVHNFCNGLGQQRGDITCEVLTLHTTWQLTFALLLSSGPHPWPFLRRTQANHSRVWSVWIQTNKIDNGGRAQKSAATSKKSSSRWERESLERMCEVTD